MKPESSDSPLTPEQVTPPALASRNGWAAQVWWPDCPWPEDVWQDTLAQIEAKYVEAVKDPHLRTCITGVLMRHGWRLAEKEIIERLTQAGIMPPNAELCGVAAKPKGTQ